MRAEIKYFDSNGNEIKEGDICDYIGINMSNFKVIMYGGELCGEGPFNTLPLHCYFNALDTESITISERAGSPFKNTNNALKPDRPSCETVCHRCQGTGRIADAFGEYHDCDCMQS